MTMDHQPEEFEHYLREFEPRRPRPLPTRQDFWKMRSAVAVAAIVMVCIGAWWLTSRKPGTTTQNGARVPAQNQPTQQVSFSLQDLTRLALEKPDEFERALTAASKNILPRFDSNDSTLRVLAKE
jgi:hypothetical protein